MLLTFRQGIVRQQTSPLFISFNSGVVDLNANTDPTVITFADGTADYLFTESQSIAGAWTGPFNVGTNYYLYWDLNLTTAERTFGFSLFPLQFGPTLPAFTNVGQHFFDTTRNQMFEWNGTNWTRRLRVFAGELQSGANINAEGLGSQVNVNQQRNVGHILFDGNAEVISRANGQFLTTETPVNATDNPINSYKLEAKQIRARAIESIPAFHAVTWKGPNRIGLASAFNADENDAMGVSAENINKDEIRKFITNGFIVNEAWNFTAAPGTLLFVGPSGEVTTEVPQRISQQRIGQVVDANTAFIDIREKFLINQVPVTPTPTVSTTPPATPTVTPTVTPTGTPAASPAVTPTVTPTITPSGTAAVTPTPTVTVTPSVTPSVSVAVSPTPTATVTPTISVTPTVTPTPSPTEAVGATDGYAAGGFSGTGGGVEAYPFSAVPASSITVGTIGTTTPGTDSIAGQSSSTDAFQNVFNSGPNNTRVERFPFAAPFTSTVFVGTLQLVGSSNLSGCQSSTDAYTAIEGSFDGNVQSFPFALPFVTASTYGRTNPIAGILDTASTNSTTDGFIIGGASQLSIQSFPFSAPATPVTSSIVGSRITPRTQFEAVADQNTGTSYHTGSATPAAAINIESFPFSSPFTTSTNVGALSVIVRGLHGAYSSTDGYMAGGFGTAVFEREIQSFPFSSPFTTATVVGNLSVDKFLGTGHQG